MKQLVDIRSMIGQQVQFKVTHLDYSPEIAAARVELVDHLSLQIDGKYLHITLFAGEGFVAADSRCLPRRIQNPEDTATSIALDKELHLKGTIKIWDFHNN